MKISVTITQKEAAETKNKIWVEPCVYLECDDIDCEKCPLRAAAENLRRAQEKFISAINSITLQN